MDYLKRRHLLLASGAALLPPLMAGCGGANAQETLPFPDVADTKYASAELVTFMNSYFAAKTRRDVSTTMSFFSPDLVTYIDATLGWDVAGFSALQGLFAQYMAQWPSTAKSYPTRIVGDMTGAMIAFTDTPELFGGELRLQGIVDFKDGRIVRWVDYWDSRGWENNFGLPKTQLLNLRESQVPARASYRFKTTGQQLAQTLGIGNAAAAVALFSEDAIYEDTALRLRLQGARQIKRYFDRAITQLPHGTGSTLRHLAGNDAGGAVEWVSAPGAPTRSGMSALVLDSDAKIIRCSVMYDGGWYSSPQLLALGALSFDN
ncbi:nuclear transport factor 2 family protein [Aquabacterium sp. J223]|uniref:nuclear transport factor 2 family protein n=1 Tax=Aquabacterium sp. J223 TaxID=2898431 RepID=UPI0021AE2EC9|nr:nuclear transport factor 2 family protein [Aquabacterium sp. J223]UUX95277.1 nuclear transport factor 2 family protein [Aquabacterium sp. J223]